MALLSKDDIFGADDLTYEDVEVPEWGGTVRIRVMTGAERNRFEQSVITRRGKHTDLNLDAIREKLIALCVVDENGERIFDESDIPALGEKNAAALTRIFDACQRLNGLTEADVDELAGNFTATPNGASISA